MRNWAVLLLLVCSAAYPHEKPIQPPPEPTHSFWLTPDNNGGKDAHIVGSALIGAGLTFQYRDMHWATRTSLCMVPGIGKELLDYAGGSGVSKQDLKNDLIGCLTGIAVGSGLAYLTSQPGGVGVAWSIPIK